MSSKITQLRNPFYYLIKTTTCNKQGAMGPSRPMQSRRNMCERVCVCVCALNVGCVNQH